jgi:hypothetical protein
MLQLKKCEQSNIGNMELLQRVRAPNKSIQPDRRQQLILDEYPTPSTTCIALRPAACALVLVR